MRLKTLNKIMALFFIELILIFPIYTSALTISGVTVADKTDKSAIVKWQTDDNSTTKVNYGIEPLNLAESIEGLSLVENHSVLLRGLNKSTNYYFEVISRTSAGTFVDNNSGNYYQFTTLAEDTEPPFIDLDIPTHIDSNEIDIIGTTETDTRIELYVNNQMVVSNIFYDGQVTFYGADLIPNQQNAILVRAIDAAGLMSQKTYSVFSDLIAPEITMPALPNVTDQSAVTVAGTLSEIALFEILLNSTVVYSAEISAFSYNLALAEGVNNVIIRATDRAGHVEEITKTIISDTIPPTIEGITPTAGSFYYEGRAIIDLSFNTEPGAQVRVYQDSRGQLRKYDETEISNADGLVRFDNIELEGVHFGPYSASAEWPPIRNVSAATAAITQSYQTIQQTEAAQRPVNLWIAVQDAAGHVTTQQISYTIGTCWSGELDFLVLPLLEYQSPTLLSPQRLEEGSELISFILNINYTGNAEEWKITDVTFDRACRGGRAGEPEFFLEDDINYNVSCHILPDSPTTKERNSKGTLWYMRYDLASTKEFSEDFLENLAQLGPGERELVFPLKLTIRYQEKEIDPVTKNKRWMPKIQTKCMSVAYFVDIPIDPRDILPDYMLEELPREMNNTINMLEGWIGNMTQIMEYVSTACLASMMTKFVVQIYRKIQCKLDTRAGLLAKAGEVTGATSGKPMCPETDEGRMSLPLNKKSRQGEKATITNPSTIIRPVDWTKLKITTADPTTIYLETRCPGCAGGWKAEAALYQLERWTCDRIFCHKAPARWTGFDKGVENLDIKKAESKARSCATEDRAGVAAIRKIENCDQEYGKYATHPKIVSTKYDTEKICYQYANSLYVLDPPDPDSDGVYTLVRVHGSDEKTLKVLKEGNTFATAIDKSCSEICKMMDSRSNVDTATKGCEPEDTCIKEKPGLDPGYLAGYSNDCWIGSEKGDAIKNKKQCCCRLPEDKTKKEAEKLKTTLVNCKPGDVPGEDCQNWEYREQEINRQNPKKYGTLYPKNRYFSGRDASACFGQNYFWESPKEGEAGKQPMMDPFRQHMSTFQCLCLTGIRQRLMFFQSILAGMRNCLLQIKETGEADAGVCQEIFSLYICDVLYQVFVWIRQGCIPLPFGKEITFGGNEVGEFGTDINADSAFEIGISSVWDSVSNMGSSIEAEYGSSQFSNFLSMEEKEVSRKMCLAAFGFDIGMDFDTMLDLTYQQQFSSSVMALGLRRDFLTYNPDNEQSTYEYRGSWTIYPGCEIINYKVDLTCVNLQEKSQRSGIDCSVPENPDNPGGCDCLYSPEPYAQRSRTFYTGTALTQSVMEDRNHHTNVEGSYRYDHMRLQLFLSPESDASKCLPEAHSDGVFYYPISDRTARDILDCIVDERGLFKCSRGLEWEEKGEAYFETFSPSDCHSSTSCDLLCFDRNPETDASGNKILWRDCDAVVHSVGNRVDIKAKISGKKKQCLKTTITTEAGNEIYSQIHDIGESGLETGYTREQDLRLGTITGDEFSATGVKINSDCDIVPVASMDESTKVAGKSGTITINPGTAANTFNIANSPQITLHPLSPTTTLIGLAQNEVTDRTFVLGGAAFRLRGTITAPKTCSVSTSSFTVKPEQKWQLNLELMHPDTHGSCTRATETISKIGYETDIDKQLRVVQSYDELCNRLKDLDASELNKLTKTIPSAELESYSCLKSATEAQPDTIVEIKSGQIIQRKDKLCYGDRVCAKAKVVTAPPPGSGATPTTELSITNFKIVDSSGKDITEIQKPKIFSVSADVSNLKSGMKVIAFFDASTDVTFNMGSDDGKRYYINIDLYTYHDFFNDFETYDTSVRVLNETNDNVIEESDIKRLKISPIS
jgi:hypothetical protein